jgi:phage repressor protein C with HTH and peptisase S24 domain
MTAEIVNLKKVRKAKARVAKDAQAAANREKFGQTKVERAMIAAREGNRNRTLDGAALTPPAANQGAFPSTANHDDDDDLDAGNVS